MRTIVQSISALGLVAIGYVWGASGTVEVNPVQAQGAAAANGGPSKETVEKITSVFNVANLAATALTNEGLYKPATKGVNMFAVVSGGVDALNDLETGRGVDPETFAGLYADQQIDDIAAKLDRDDQGRITYNNKVVRMYPISRLKKLYQQRLLFSGEEP